jgi:hypothetical protein
MGYYTELKFSAQLRPDTELFSLLESLSKDEMFEKLTGKELPALSAVANTPNLPINHEFGKTHRWDQMLNSNTMKLNVSRKTLKVNCEIKAYEDDYEKFIDWLKPFIISGTAETKGEMDSSWNKIFKEDK